MAGRAATAAAPPTVLRNTRRPARCCRTPTIALLRGFAARMMAGSTSRNAGAAYHRAPGLSTNGRPAGAAHRNATVGRLGCLLELVPSRSPGRDGGQDPA